MSTFYGHDAPPARVMAEIIAVSLEMRDLCPTTTGNHNRRLAADIRRFADRACGLTFEEAANRRGKYLSAADISPMLRGNFLD